MLRYLLPASCLLAAAPAWAVDYCKASVTRDGREAIAEAFVDGDTLQRIRIEDIPIASKVTMDPAAKGYTVAAGGAVSLTPYRSGRPLEGKNWQTPGSVSTVFGGMALQWPRFYKDGNDIGETQVVFVVDGLRQGITTAGDATTPAAQNLYVDWDPAWALTSPHNYRGQSLYTPKEVQFWPNVAAPGSSIGVEFYDITRGVFLGSVVLDWPQQAPWNARMVEQVNALRAMSAAKKCTVAVTIKLGGDDDEEDEEF